MIKRRVNKHVVIKTENSFLYINTVRIQMSEDLILLKQLNTVVGIYQDLNKLGN